MNGWWRIGVVIAGLIAIPAAMVGWENAARGYAWGIPPPRLAPIGSVKLTVEQQVWNENKSRRDLKACDLETVRVTADTYGGTYSISCDKGMWAQANGAITYGAIPFGILLMIGSLIAWIYRGFRPNK